MAHASHPNHDNRQRLGRGLAALLGDAKPSEEASELLDGVRHVPIEFVRSSSRNPRQSFNQEELQDLAASIQARGIIQPIIVRPVVGTGDAYEIVAGERRWRAAQLAGKHAVPVVILQVTDREALELSIIENIQRSDLNALEEARGYAQLASEYGYNHADVGRVVGKSRSHVANTLRLLGLPERVKELLVTRSLTAGHARALLSSTDPIAVADKIVAQGLSVRDVERLTSEVLSPQKIPKENTPSDVGTSDLTNRLSLTLGAEVHILDRGRKHEVRIKFDNLDQLNSLCDRLLGL